MHTSSTIDDRDMRFGGRAELGIRGVLQVGASMHRGVIENVSLGGAGFACRAPALEAGVRGLLTRDGGRAVPVTVVWNAGGMAGLAFEPLQPL